MRVIQAFTIQRIGPDALSGLLDWLLTPIYFKFAYPSHTLVLYTDQKSVDALGNLWEHIKNRYDEVNIIKVPEIPFIFSTPKFEAIKYELKNHDSNFAIIDNDLYVFKGFLDNLPDYALYYNDNIIMAWYKIIMNNEYSVLNAPSWMTWKSDPYNCAIIRLNNKNILGEYVDLFYQVKAEKLTYNRLENTMIKEQWVLGELLKKYSITPTFMRQLHKSLHKGNFKQKCKPSHMITVQEYLLSWLDPLAFKVYKELRKKLLTQPIPDYDINWCLDSFFTQFEKEGLLAPVKLLQDKSNK